MKSILSRNGRKTLAVSLAGLNTRYDYSLYAGIRKAALKRGFNLINLICGSMDSLQPFSYDFEYNQLYYLLNDQSVDGIIVLPSLITNYSTKDRLAEVLAQYPNTPKVSISEPVPGIPGVFVDNIGGIRTMVSHFFTNHHKKRFSFISGPISNTDSNDRLEGFKLGLQDCGLEFDARYIFRGDFWMHGGRAAARYFFSDNFAPPEVIVCANDYIAQGAYEVLKQLKVKIPEQVAVTGFDNMHNSDFFNPPLTSIDQPFEQMAEQAVDCLARIFAGEKVETEYRLPTTVVYRRSCGCLVANPAYSAEKNIVELFNSPDIRRALNQWTARVEGGIVNNRLPEDELLGSLSDLLFHSMDLGIDFKLWLVFFDYLKQDLLAKWGERLPVLALFLMKVQGKIAEIKELAMALSVSNKADFALLQTGAIQNLINVFSLNGFLSKIGEELPRLGITSFFINLFPKPFIHTQPEKWIHPEKSKFLFGFHAGKTYSAVTKTSLFDTAKLLPKQVEFEDRPYVFLVIGMFFRETQFGYMLFETTSADQQVCLDVATQVSSVYNGVLLFEEREKKARELKRTLQKLQNSNRKLNDLSIHDALTGLYNRRGFLLLCEKQHNQAIRNKNSYLLFFADIDGLKEINDSWGHSEGDAVIAAGAAVLQQTFRTSDIIARLGGDEFTIFTINSYKETVDLVLGRLNQLIADYNRVSGKSYKLGISIGAACFSEHPNYSFQEMMATADANLYERKKNRKRTSATQV